MKCNAIVGRHDSLSCVTGWTLVHAASGAIIGLCCDWADLGTRAAVAVAVGLAAGWEMDEYWAAPALGYWAVRNTANTAIDVAAVVSAWMAVYGMAWRWQQGLVVLFVALGAAVGFFSSAARDYNPEAAPVQGAWEQHILFKLRALRRRLPCKRNADQHRQQQKDVAFARTGLPDAGGKLPWPDGGLQDRVLLSPPHRMLAALHAVLIAAHAAKGADWSALPTNLVAALVGFALTMPSRDILVQEDVHGYEPQAHPETYRGSLACCPLYRTWPHRSEDIQRHRGRDRARRLFRTMCLPVRFVLTATLLIGGPYLDKEAAPVLGCAAIAAFFFVLKGIVQERRGRVPRVWWSREYLLLEIAGAAALFFAVDLPVACYAVASVLMAHWVASVWISAWWPRTESVQESKSRRAEQKNLANVELKF